MSIINIDTYKPLQQLTNPVEWQKTLERWDKMEVISNREETIYRNEFNGEVRYSIALSKKKEDGEYENGYMKVIFRKGVSIENKSKIRITDAWLSFNNFNNKTYPYIFINNFDLVDKPANQFSNMKTKIESDIGQQIEITDDDLPF